MEVISLPLPSLFVYLYGLFWFTLYTIIAALDGYVFRREQTWDEVAKGRSAFRSLEAKLTFSSDALLGHQRALSPLHHPFHRCANPLHFQCPLRHLKVSEPDRLYPWLAQQLYHVASVS